MKVGFYAVLVGSMLVLASFAPAAFAQAAVEDDENGSTVTFVDCSQVQSVFANQGQYANADADAGRNGEAAAEIAQELGISQNQVNRCLGGGTGGNTPDPGRGENDDGDDERELPEGEDEVIPGTAADGELPETGGPSLLAVGLGFALVAGGVSLVRSRR